ncbi:MAG: nitroreductase family protein [Armatimonadetes bacterium]|nr:nitroreductase family protein [Armatimonadota bacterium]
MDAYRCLVTKRDLRSYLDRPIDRPTLLKILDAARRAGSSRNRQPWQFIAVTERETMRRLSRCGRFAAHLASAAAAVIVVVEAARDLFDAGRCAQNLMLAAWSLGIASCPASLHHDAEARAVLGLPEGAVLAITVALGYPDSRGRGRIERLALRVLAGRGRRPLEDLVHWERYGNRGG